ncbi:phenylacetate-CoA ligase [Thiogranum longum]|uniref:Phenylacetate-CoA ligase n=1 Tax=Thiogranum longum TaxID=1537524 RepID=A0A4R1HAQ5_9GAMM|nr:phenylacetate--CoA ligase family protein [Thiogranum longum]TCK19044.1 phenylacetate-CoA ligase [Thiogranum longum]
MLTLYRTYRSLARSQWLTTEQLHLLRQKKLQELVSHAYTHVPYYHKLFRKAGIHPTDIRTFDDLSHIPVTTKRDLLEAGPGQITSGVFPARKLVAERTTGSTGEPFTVFLDRNWLRVRKALFLRALHTAGWRPGRKLVFVTAGRKPWHRRIMGWHYISFADSPESMREQLNRIRPDVLYGWVTPLRELARYIRDTGKRIHSPQVTITTAETLVAQDRELIGRAFKSRLCEFFGMTEMGIIGWECREAGQMHIAEDTCHAELAPDHDTSGTGRLVMTNLELRATPFIRYETGDLARFGPATACRCGRSLRTLARIDGRLVDCIRLEDGRVISPYQVTLALEPLKGIGRFHVIQENPGKISVELEANQKDADALQSAVRNALIPLTGTGVELGIVLKQTLAMQPGRKFRVVENRCIQQSTP